MTGRAPALAAVALGACACGGTVEPRPSPSPMPAQAPFREASAEAGLEFRHFTGATGKLYMPEIMGSGVALADYDADGDLDVYLVQGDRVAGDGEPLFPVPGSHWPGSRLYRNDLVPGGGARFTDVTEAAGVGHRGVGMGVATGDYDNDGDADLYLTAFGSNVLYRNEGNGTFTDVTRQAGVDDTRWSTGAAFADYDRDGDLDLVVVNYVDFRVEGNRKCTSRAGEPDYCTPQAYSPTTARLFRNDGRGRFTDVSEPSGIASKAGPGLGVVCADLNGDGWTDIYAANDGAANHLWINRGNGTFVEEGLMSGTAYNADGRPEASMGVSAGDFDADGDEDLFMTHLLNEKNTLYRNDGKGMFHDATAAFGLDAASLPFTGFGTQWFDYDNDGFLDLFVTNGAVQIVDALRGTPYPYHQRKQLFRNLGPPKFAFAEVVPEPGSALGLSEVGRGAAFGDVDNDGDVDIVVSNNNGPARLLLNETARRHWLTVQLTGVSANRGAIGARVAVLRAGQPLWRRAHTDGSYLSANDPRVHFGLGDDPAIEGVGVVWPGGRREMWSTVRADGLVALREGSGAPWP
jgi:hypothetical protein